MFPWGGPPRRQGGHGYPFSTSDHAKQNSLVAREGVVTSLRRQVDRLKRQRDDLLEKLRQHDETTFISAAHVQGFVLRDMARNTNSSGQISYTATGAGHFKIFILEKDNVVQSIKISILEDSPLIEIQNALNELTKELCPRRILMTVQQFFAMHEFRHNVVNEFIKPNARCFRCYMPDETKGSIKDSLCSIRAYDKRKPVLDLQWTFVYDSVQQSLVHKFESTKSLDYLVIPVHVVKFTVALKNNYTLAKHNELWDKWHEFCNWIITK